MKKALSLIALLVAGYVAQGQTVATPLICNATDSTLKFTPCDSLRKALGFDWHNTDAKQRDAYVTQMKLIYPDTCTFESAWDYSRTVDRFIINDGTILELEKHYKKGAILYFQNGDTISEEQFFKPLLKYYYPH